MASLARALDEVDEDFLLLESDLFYEERALDALLRNDARDVLLASGPTGATDEVWVEAPDGRLTGLSKQADDLSQVSGELVGIVKVSRALGRRLAESFAAFERANGHGRMAYETDALVEVARDHPIHVTVVDDLLWGEVDDETHYRRLCDEVFPCWNARRDAAD
jgi:2-aminoethylphosphonate-pyruvate transaminase